MPILALVVAAQVSTTTSDLMVKTIYPASDAIFYIETRTPATDADWTALQRQTEALGAAADELMRPARARGREQWIADGRLLVEASAAASAAATRKDVAALAALNERLYQSCVQCHQHYRPGYGARSVSRLEGTWNFSTVTPLERPAEFAGRATMTDAEARAYAARVVDQRNVDRRPESRDADVAAAYNDAWYDRGVGVATVDGRHQTSLVVDPPDGRIPAQTADARQKASARAADRRQHPADGPEDRSLGERCLSFNAGPPMMTGPYNNYVQIFQRDEAIVIFNEMIHDARVVPIDATPQAHAPATIRRWQGDSRAHWEGATLVVDTTNFTDKTSFRGTDEHLHLVERFTRVDAGTLLYEFTIDDPTAFTRPWTVSLPMTRSDDRVYEYACHEGNYALADILRGARDEERRRR
ncbi:MAG TPA: hypothetical protein VFA27_04660 [Vicinamibacterales bacterium]|nr:hypothetical protein [Vicinamibacterales bacterium]